MSYAKMNMCKTKDKGKKGYRSHTVSDYLKKLGIDVKGEMQYGCETDKRKEIRNQQTQIPGSKTPLPSVSGMEKRT